MDKFMIGCGSGILAAIITNMTAPITIINFITGMLMAIFKLFCALIGCFLAYTICMMLGMCIPIITSKLWENAKWSWEIVKNYEETDAEI